VVKYGFVILDFEITLNIEFLDDITKGKYQLKKRNIHLCTLVIRIVKYAMKIMYSLLTQAHTF
jgi:hypothetical protein